MYVYGWRWLFLLFIVVAVDDACTTQFVIIAYFLMPYLLRSINDCAYKEFFAIIHIYKLQFNENYVRYLNLWWAN